MAKKIAEIRSHWNHFFDGFSTSAQEYFQTVEEAVKAKQLPDISFSRIDFREGGIFSAKREYLRVEHHDHIFDICAAPFGTGFFFSWWLADPAPSGPWGMIVSIPYLGAIVQRLFRPWTYYKKDTSSMVQSSINNAIQDVIKSITTAKGIRELSEAERKPIMRDLFGR